MKRYLPDERNRIRLRDLIREATEELVVHINAETDATKPGFPVEELPSRVRRLEALSERTVALVANGCYPHDIVREAVAHALHPHPDPRQKYLTPLSQYLQATLRPIFDELVPAEQDYVEAFDRFEYLASLVHADLHERRYQAIGFAGGCFEWRRHPSTGWVSRVIAAEIEEMGQRWPSLQAGLFDGSVERLLEVKRGVDELVARSRH